MYDDDYDPEEDPIELKKQEIQKLKTVIYILGDISKYIEHQQYKLNTVNDRLGAIHSNVRLASIILIIIALILVFK